MASPPLAGGGQQLPAHKRWPGSGAECSHGKAAVRGPGPELTRTRRHGSPIVRSSACRGPLAGAEEANRVTPATPTLPSCLRQAWRRKAVVHVIWRRRPSLMAPPSAPRRGEAIIGRRSLMGHPPRPNLKHAIPSGTEAAWTRTSADLPPRLRPRTPCPSSSQLLATTTRQGRKLGGRSPSRPCSQAAEGSIIDR